MLIPTRSLDEPLRAELAGVGFLPGVDPLVGLHVDFLHEGLAAKLARELLILEMNLFVAFSEMALSVKLVKQRRVFRIRTAKIG